MELVDEAGEAVPQILQLYRDVLSGKRGAREAQRWLDTVPDSNGRAHGSSEGSLAVVRERGRSGMKATAAAQLR